MRVKNSLASLSFKYVHLLYPLVPELRVTGGQLEPIPAVIERRQGDTLDELPRRERQTTIRTHIHTYGQF